MGRLMLVLAENPRAAKDYAANNVKGLTVEDEIMIINSSRSIEGLRFRYEDVIRVPGWSKNPEIEEIEDCILRTHVTCSRRTTS